MIQRIQTIYLVLGALALGALGLFDVPWSGAAAQQAAWFVPSLLGLVVVASVLAIGAIFLYKDQSQRKTQRTIVVGVQILTLILAGIMYVGLYRAGTLAFTGPAGVLWGRSVVLLLPIVAYVLFRLARRGIEKDIDRVDRMDQGRIR